MSNSSQLELHPCSAINPEILYMYNNHTEFIAGRCIYLLIETIHSDNGGEVVHIINTLKYPLRSTLLSKWSQTSISEVR